ncbi:helix-turn-helix domain-containing protein [Agrobacterium vitis]|uniref:helix-turn-helix domain-containing protein n=1 Tax=Agrobacterium vitis TaxID=373 RepID=UPI003D2BD5D2
MNGIVLNEKELRDAKARVAKLSDALSSESGIVQLVSNLPPEVITQVTKMMKAERLRLLAAIEAFDSAKSEGDTAPLLKQSGTDPGVTLIVARIAKGYSQKDLARRLGVKEQQVQRYEADRYSSISLKNYTRVAALLGVQLHATIRENPSFRGLDAVIADVSRDDIRKILKHGRARGWFAEDMSEGQLRQYIAENRIEFGSPSLLRTGLNVTDHSEDVLLHAWRARVSALAREILSREALSFDPLDINWLSELVRLSSYADGPVRARDMLRQKGILLVAEPQIPGLAIDGAAFLEGSVPVIGMAIRKDTVDNFWFTLLHEIGHSVLHYRTGLATGFFDQLETVSTDEQEAEANSFASNILIPEEKWRRSTARIANSSEVVEKFAKELGIHPAIVFGRIRKERNNYALFSNKIGANTVREQLIGPT